MPQNVLILGASGRFGRNAAQAFADAGWQVHRFDRRSDDLTQAVRGVDVIVNAWNPAYPDWARQVPELHAQVIAAARTVDATVIVPGNVYVYGPDRPGLWTSETPHAATNPLGRIRRDMEAAYRASGVRTIILRAGDFIDTRASGNWFDMIMTKSIARGTFTYPGRTDVAHAWAYLPDLACAAVALAEARHTLARFEEVLYPGYTLTGEEMARALAGVTGRPVRTRRFPWWQLRLVAPFWRMGRCLLEMRYLWNTSHELDGTRLDALLPDIQTTRLPRALAQALPQEVVSVAAPVQSAQNARSTQTIR